MSSHMSESCLCLATYQIVCQSQGLGNIIVLEKKIIRNKLGCKPSGYALQLLSIDWYILAYRTPDAHSGPKSLPSVAKHLQCLCYTGTFSLQKPAHEVDLALPRQPLREPIQQKHRPKNLQERHHV